MIMKMNKFIFFQLILTLSLFSGCVKDDMLDVVSDSYIDADIYVEDKYFVASIYEYQSSVTGVRCVLEISTDPSMSDAREISFNDGVASWGPLSSWTSYYYRIKMENSHDYFSNDIWVLIMDGDGYIYSNQKHVEGNSNGEDTSTY